MTLTIVALTLVPFFSTGNILRPWKKTANSGYRVTINEFFKEKGGIPQDSNILILSNHDSSGYLHYICKYDFWSTAIKNVKVVESIDAAAIAEDTNNFEYIIVLIDEQKQEAKLIFDDILKQPVIDQEKIILI